MPQASPPEDSAPSTKLPPQNLDAEVAVLGSVLLSNDVMVDARAAGLQADDFYHEHHRNVFRAMVALDDATPRQPIDYLTVLEQLEVHGKADGDPMSAEARAGGLDYLSGLVDRVPSAANVAYYAGQVRKNAILRQLIAVTHEIHHDAYEFHGDIDELLGEATSRVQAIQDQSLPVHQTSLADMLREAAASIDGSGKAPVTAVASVPIRAFAQEGEAPGIWPFFAAGEQTVLAGRPGMGKSSLAIGIATQVALDQQVPVFVLSLEASAKQVAVIAACQQAWCDTRMFRTNRYPPESQYQRLLAAMGRMSESECALHIVSNYRAAPQALAACKRAAMRQGCKLFIIDYLQLLTPPPGARQRNREQAVAEMSAMFKGFAIEYDVHTIVLAQLNRDVSKRANPRPLLSDLRESGSLEQDADNVLFVHRPYYYTRAPEDDGRAELILAKQRNGPIGDVRVSWHPWCQRFDVLYERGPDAEYADDDADGGRARHETRDLPMPEPVVLGPGESVGAFDADYTGDPNG